MLTACIEQGRIIDFDLRIERGSDRLPVLALSGFEDAANHLNVLARRRHRPRSISPFGLSSQWAETALFCPNRT
jgi:hypothetical protein